MVHCENGNFDDIQKMMTKWSKKRLREELDKTNNVGNSALSLAVKNNYHSIAQYLIDYGSDVNGKTNNSKQPILFIPCWKNDLQMVKILLDADADINFQDSRGWTALMIASAQGFEDMVEYLISRNAKTELKDKYGKRAVDKAKSQGIFYMLSSAAIDQRMMQSNDQVNQIIPDSELESFDKSNFQTEPEKYPGCGSVKKELFNSTMPKQKSANRMSRSRSKTPSRVSRTPTRVQSQVTPKSNFKVKKSNKKDTIMKVIYNSIKRNEDRMNLAQKSIFSTLVQEEVMDSTSGIFEKLNRAIVTYNEKIKKELVNHVNLKLKIACIERGVFNKEDFDKNIGLNVLTLADIKNVPNITQKAFKISKKEQTKIEEFLKMPSEVTPKNRTKYDLKQDRSPLNRDLNEDSSGNDLRQQLVAMISDKINQVEDNNVKNCAGLIKDIVADKISKLQNILEENMDRTIKEIQRGYEKRFSHLIEEKCNFLFTQNRKAIKNMMKEKPESPREQPSFKRVNQSASKSPSLKENTKEKLPSGRPKEISFNAPLKKMRSSSKKSSKSGKKSRKYKFSNSHYDIPRMRMQIQDEKEENEYTEERPLNILSENGSVNNEIPFTNINYFSGGADDNPSSERFPLPKPPRDTKVEPIIEHEFKEHDFEQALPDFKRPKEGQKKSSVQAHVIPAHSLAIPEKEEENPPTNLGYNFDELDFHEDNNTEQEEYRLGKQKFRSKKMQELSQKYSESNLSN
ncbi:unnamed protein product [Moneuplotes crassus]|uniref:Uncharacterized protein n=2 Tax=Euplotes crassus TaxID=5936 RepID=A0AAD1Y8A7_EUPCR|nr:unnamed protein product [Moneuplotes crassus]